MATKKSSKQRSGAFVAEIGAGLLAAAAAAGTGYYFYASDDAKKHRKIATKWADGMKKDVIREAKALQQVSPAAYGRIVDEAAAAYVTAKNIRRADVLAAAQELKKHWDKVQKELPSRVRNAAKKPVRKAKKVVKKAKKKARS